MILRFSRLLLGIIHVRNSPREVIDERRPLKISSCNLAFSFWKLVPSEISNFLRRVWFQGRATWGMTPRWEFFANVLRLLLLFLNMLLVQACVTYTATPPMPRVTISPNFRPEVYDRLAVIVMDQTRRFWQSGVLREVEDEFMRKVIEKGYALAARSDVDRIIEELKFQSSSLTEQQVARIGHILNIPAVLLVSINHISTQEQEGNLLLKLMSTILTIPGVLQASIHTSTQEQGRKLYVTKVSISARLISAERGEILCISSYSGQYYFSRKEDEVLILAPVARVVASALPDAPWEKSLNTMKYMFAATKNEVQQFIDAEISRIANLGVRAIFDLSSQGLQAMKAGDFRKAIDPYEKLLEIDPENFEAFFNLAGAHCEINMLDRALNYASKALNRIADPRMFFVVASVYVKKDAKEEALYWLEKALKGGFTDRKMIEENFVKYRDDRAYIALGQKYGVL